MPDDRRVPPGYLYVPKFREKLRWLYARHSEVVSGAKLAATLEVAPSLVSPWVTLNAVPAKYLLPREDGRPTLCSIFEIPYRTFEAPTIEEFRDLIEQQPGGWMRLVDQAAGASALEITGDPNRGVSDPDDPDHIPDPNMPHFSVGDEIMIKVTHRGRWHGLLLMEDPERKWSCLWPRKNTPDTEFENEFSFPRHAADAPRRFGKVTAPAGLHRVVGIVTKKDGLLNQLEDIYVYPIRTENLDELAAELRRIRREDPDSWVAMTKCFYAGPSSA